MSRERSLRVNTLSRHKTPEQTLVQKTELRRKHYVQKTKLRVPHPSRLFAKGGIHGSQTNGPCIGSNPDEQSTFKP